VWGRAVCQVVLDLLQKYEAWLPLVLGGTMIAEAADHCQLDGSTITRIRTIKARWRFQG
jgi:hypothetical protein